MPTQHLSNQFIRTLHNPEKRTEYYDDHLIKDNKLKKSGVKGLALRVTPAGSKSFVYRYWYDDRSKRLTIGSYPTLSLTKARKKAKELHELVTQGIDPLREKENRIEDKPMTFSEAIDSYKEHHLPTLKESTKTDYKCRIKHLIKGEGKDDTKVRGFDGSRYIKNLKRHEIIDFLNEIGKTAPTQANRLQAIISGIFKHAKDREWVTTNIASEIRIKSKRGGNKNKRKHQNTSLCNSDIRELWNVFDKHDEPVGSYFKMLLLLGQRAGETRLMKWADINEREKTWTIPASDTKNGESNFVPLPTKAIEILQEMKPWADGEFVFESQINRGKPIGTQQKAAQRIRKNFKVKDFNIHSLRTTVATNLAGLGIAPQVLSKLLNHKKPGEGSLITAIYNKYNYEDELRTALKRWEIKLNDIVSNNKKTSTTIHRLG